VHNVEAVLTAFLPYHDSSHFARLVSLLSLSGKWSFLSGVARTSSPLPRSVLVRAATTDPSLLSFIVSNGLTDTSTPASSSLAAAVTLDLCAACPSLPENTVTLVLASALPCVRSVTRRETLAAALMCVASVCGRAQVSSEVADTVTNTCVRRAVGGKTDSPFDADPLLAAIVVLCFKPLQSISRSRALCKLPRMFPSNTLPSAADTLRHGSFALLLTSSFPSSNPYRHLLTHGDLPPSPSPPPPPPSSSSHSSSSSSPFVRAAAAALCDCVWRGGHYVSFLLQVLHTPPHRSRHCRVPLTRRALLLPSVLRACSHLFLRLRHRESCNPNSSGWPPPSCS
jgi:hypothetical protein